MVVFVDFLVFFFALAGLCMRRIIWSIRQAVHAPNLSGPSVSRVCRRLSFPVLMQVVIRLLHSNLLLPGVSNATSLNCDCLPVAGS
jgi:hypothetical protein